MLSLASMTSKRKLPSLESSKQLEGSLHNMVPSLTSTPPLEKSNSLQIGTMEFCLSFVATTWKGISPSTVLKFAAFKIDYQFPPDASASDSIRLMKMNAADESLEKGRPYMAAHRVDGRAIASPCQPGREQMCRIRVKVDIAPPPDRLPLQEADETE